MGLKGEEEEGEYKRSLPQLCVGGEKSEEESSVPYARRLCPQCRRAGWAFCREHLPRHKLLCLPNTGCKQPALPSSP